MLAHFLCILPNYELKTRGKIEVIFKQEKVLKNGVQYTKKEWEIQVFIKEGEKEKWKEIKGICIRGAHFLVVELLKKEKKAFTIRKAFTDSVFLGNL